MKLLNNALDTYNLAATARMLNRAAQPGAPAKSLYEVIGVSTGHSWTSDNLIDVQYDLLLKDAAAPRRNRLTSTTDLDDDVEQAILHARTLLTSDASNE